MKLWLLNAVTVRMVIGFIRNVFELQTFLASSEFETKLCLQLHYSLIPDHVQISTMFDKTLFTPLFGLSFIQNVCLLVCALASWPVIIVAMFDARLSSIQVYCT